MLIPNYSLGPSLSAVSVYFHFKLHFVRTNIAVPESKNAAATSEKLRAPIEGPQHSIFFSSEKIHVNGCMTVVWLALYKHVMPTLMICALVNKSNFWFLGSGCSATVERRSLN